jgi:peptidoglycan/xylan/chitin deacetylase (PgdA/CDA1 family)
MMKRSHFFFLFIFTLFISACGTTPTTKETASTEVVKKDTLIATAPKELNPNAVTTALDTPGSSAPHVYLTIDDGPSPFSNAIIDVAKEKNAKMTVFLVGNNMWSKKYRESLNQYRNNPLLELGNHSFSHANGKYSSYYKNPNGVLLDFYKNIVQMQLPNSLARLPGRSFWALGQKELINQESGKHAARLLQQKGFKLFGWDVEWFYHHKTGAPKGSAEQVFAEIQKSLKTKQTFLNGHCVVLLHERHFQQKYEIAKLITLCQKEGYILEHLKNFPTPPPATATTAAKI